ncbi:MAG: hypothetical protein VSS75_018765 [Candidatus Parabeggiatoa sp.]|nr:hypothetical protein [Candidatus Parabeggiatoa sp.]
MVEKGRALAKEGQIEAAIEQFKQAQKVDERFKFGGGVEDYARRLSKQSESELSGFEDF